MLKRENVLPKNFTISHNQKLFESKVEQQEENPNNEAAGKKPLEPKTEQEEKGKPNGRTPNNNQLAGEKSFEPKVEQKGSPNGKTPSNNDPADEKPPKIKQEQLP